MPFIVGVPRSGTTLLRMMLDAHPELSIPPEMGFLPDVIKLRGRGDALRQLFVAAVVGKPTWTDANLDLAQFHHALLSVEPFTIPEGVRTFYRVYAARFGKSRWGDKTPSYCLYMNGIEKLLPEARFIHIIRDGRDVALSLRGLWFSPGDDIESLANHWKSWITTARRQGRRLRHYIEVRYEDLVRDTSNILRTLCNFIELPYEPRMEQYYMHSGERLAEIGTMFGSDGKPIITKEERLYNQRFTMKPPDESRIFRWRSEMDDVTRAGFSKVAGRLLAELGYPGE